MINIPRIIEFVYNVFGENILLANLTLKEFGIDPEKLYQAQQEVDATMTYEAQILEHLEAALELLRTPITYNQRGNNDKTNYKT